MVSFRRRAHSHHISGRQGSSPSISMRRAVGTPSQSPLEAAQGARQKGKDGSSPKDDEETRLPGG
jgi:hypothetical protein